MKTKLFILALLLTSCSEETSRNFAQGMSMGLDGYNSNPYNSPAYQIQRQQLYNQQQQTYQLQQLNNAIRTQPYLGY